MALIRGASATAAAKDGVVLNLGDLARQGEAIVASAKKRAEAIVREAEGERARLIAGASEEGRKQGLIEGEKQGRATGEKLGREAAQKERAAALAGIEKSWTEALGAWEKAREAVTGEAREAVVRLALEIARRLVKRRIDTDPAGAVVQLEAALAMISRPTELTVSVHPHDRAVIEAALPTLAKRFAGARGVELVEDEGVGRAGCVLRSRGALGGEIDATIASQAQRIADALGVKMIAEPAPAPALDAAHPPADGARERAGPETEA
jgi:flagellar assembly protein FliH